MIFFEICKFLFELTLDFQKPLYTIGVLNTQRFGVFVHGTSIGFQWRNFAPQKITPIISRHYYGDDTLLDLFMRVSFVPYRRGQRKLQLLLNLILSRQIREQNRIIVRTNVR